MSELSTQEILQMIDDNDGPEGVDVSGKDLSEIDLSGDIVRGEQRQRCFARRDTLPAWAYRGILSSWVLGIDLSFAKLQGANLEGADLLGANLKHGHLKGTKL